MRFRRLPQSLASVTCWLVLVPFCLSTVPLGAQEAVPLTWDNVLRLRTGDQIFVTTESDKFPGSVQRADPDSLAMVTTDKRELLLPRDKVKSVGYQGTHAKLGWALVAAGIMVTTASLVIDTGRDLNSLSSGSLPGNHSQVGAIVGLGIAAGGVVMVLKGGAKVIYRRPERTGSSPAK